MTELVVDQAGGFGPRQKTEFGSDGGEDQIELREKPELPSQAVRTHERGRASGGKLHAPDRCEAEAAEWSGSDQGELAIQPGVAQARARDSGQVDHRMISLLEQRDGEREPECQTLSDPSHQRDIR